MPLRLALWISCALLGSGCSLFRSAKPERDVALPIGQPHLLFAAADPYPALHVEIDAIEGCAPTAEEIAALQAFLARYCNKPGGVRVVLDNIIPKSTARGRSVTSLELQYLNGPPDDWSAFLYFLCYHSGVVRDPKTNPYFTYHPYAASIFIDRAYGTLVRWLTGRTFDRLVLLHESGHALGLGQTGPKARSGHCVNNACLMAPALSWNFRQFLRGRDPWGKQHDLCADCQQQSAEDRIARAPDNVRFLGPYLVRSESGYHVLSLPYFVYVHIGDLATLDRAALEDVRAQTAAANEVDTTETKTSNIGIAEVPAIASALLQDRSSYVRYLGTALLNKAFAFPDEWAPLLTSALGDLPDASTRQRLVNEIMAPATPYDLLSAAENEVFLSDAEWSAAQVGWGDVARNRYHLHADDVGDRDWRDFMFLSLGGERYGKGLYAHSPSRYAFQLGRKWRTFSAKVGLRDGADETGSAVFIVRGDGRELYRSPLLRVGQSAEVSVDISTVNQLELLADGAEGHNTFSWAIWAAPRVVR